MKECIDLLVLHRFDLLNKQLSFHPQCISINGNNSMNCVSKIEGGGDNNCLRVVLGFVDVLEE